MASLAPHSGNLGTRLAAHLLRRLTFGFTRADVDTYAGMTADQAVDALLNTPSALPPPLDPATNATWVINGPTASNSSSSRLYKYLTGWWVDECFHTTSAIQRMVFFLHSILTSDDGIQSTNLYNQLLLFRHFAYGSYKDLVQKICMDNGMLDYLDGRKSKKNNPTENFPRELLELFTIGKGAQISPGNYTTYTESDIQEASRLFTGFRQDLSYSTIDPDTNIPMGKTLLSQHDDTNKTFSSAFQGTIIAGKNTATGMLEEIEDFVDMVFDQGATAKNIMRKLYRYLVHAHITPEIESDIIAPLANTFANNNYEFMPVLKKLLKSQHFYDADDTDGSDETIGAMIKSPLQLLIGTMKYFDIPVPDPAVDLYKHYHNFYRNVFLRHMCELGGIDPFNPDDVSGYAAHFQEPGYDELWLNETTLNYRYLYADMFIQGKKLPSNNNLYTELDVMTFVNNQSIIKPFVGVDYNGLPGTFSGGRIAPHLVDELLTYLLPEAPISSRRSYFLDDLLLDTFTPLNWQNEWDSYISTGNDAIVRRQIEKLIRGILQSPEYQLF